MLMRASMLAVLFSGVMSAQETTTSMRDYLAPEKANRNVFEDPKGASPEFDGVKVTVGGDFALQFQQVFTGRHIDCMSQANEHHFCSKQWLARIAHLADALEKHLPGAGEMSHAEARCIISAP